VESDIGGIYIQSNAEDVAVTLENLMRQNCQALTPRHKPLSSFSNQPNGQGASQLEHEIGGSDEEEATRHSKYLKMVRLSASMEGGGGGDSGSWMRAEGEGWWDHPPSFFAYGKTETEAMCDAENKPVYRMWWGKRKDF